MPRSRSRRQVAARGAGGGGVAGAEIGAGVDVAWSTRPSSGLLAASAGWSRVGRGGGAATSSSLPAQMGQACDGADM